MATFEEARNFLMVNRTDYQKAFAGFRWPDTPTFNWALDWFDGVLATERETKDNTALWIVSANGNVQYQATFAELSRRSNQAAHFLENQGCIRGDRLLLLLGNVGSLWELVLGAMKIGAVIIPATTLLTAEELEDRVTRGGAKFILTSSDQIEKCRSISPGIKKIVVGDTVVENGDPCPLSESFSPAGPTLISDPLLLYFTSGATSKPKLVQHTHQSYPIGHLSTMYWIGFKPGDIHTNISSAGWAKHSWSSLFAPWNAGATIFLLNQPRFEARPLLDALVTYRVTTMCAPPTVWRRLIQENLSHWKTSLRELVSAGEPLNPEVIDQVRNAWGLTIREGYGQTETTAAVANTPDQRIKNGAMGRPLPGYNVAILDSDGIRGSEGELCFSTDDQIPVGLMQGYTNESGTITASGIVDGYYHTGDTASMDEDGYLTFIGRADDVFKCSGYRISPFELESVLIEHAVVAEAAVVPSPDAVRSSVPKAFVSLVPGTTPTREIVLSIFEHTHQRLAPYKRIRRIEVVVDLPKTISGKIRRAVLRKLELEQGAGDRKAGAIFTEDDFPELKNH